MLIYVPESFTIVFVAKLFFTFYNFVITKGEIYLIFKVIFVHIFFFALISNY